MEIELSIVEALPVEALLRVLRHLDAQSIIQARLLSHMLRNLADEPYLWRKLCHDTNRICGKHTLNVCEQYSEKKSWKACYFWIEKKDLEIPQNDQEVIDRANAIESDALKRHFCFARVIDLNIFPKSSSLLQQFADFLVEQPNERDSWNCADSLYKQAITLASTPPVLENKDDPACELEYKEELRKNKNSLLFCHFRFAHFLATNRELYTEADKHYRKLISMLPNNSWVLERYAEFVSEHLHKHNLAENLYRRILSYSPTGSSVASYAYFLWHIKKEYQTAGKCFKVAMDLNSEKAYFYANFIGRCLRDEPFAKEMLENSKLFEHVNDNPKDEQSLFSLALAFHQIHCTDEAEDLYRRHIQQTKNVYTLSNLAELLVHSRGKFQEAELLYNQGLQMISGAHETIEVALVGLGLIQGREGSIEKLDKLLRSDHIKAARNTYTEAWILYYIHGDANCKKEALPYIKTQMVTHCVRPKLILMFDANLNWASTNSTPKDYEFVKQLCSVYNCEEEIETLDQFEEWNQIVVEPCRTIEDNNEDINQFLLNLLQDDDDDDDDDDQ